MRCNKCVAKKGSDLCDECTKTATGSFSPEFTGCMVKVVKKERYRSKPKVNMADDMVRVTLTMPIWKWGEMERNLT